MQSSGKPSGSVLAQWNINSLFWGIIAPNLQCWKGGVDCLCVSLFQSFTLLQLLWYLQWSHSMQSHHSLRHSRPSYLPSLCLSVDFNISVSLWLFLSLYRALREPLCAPLGRQLVPVCVHLVPQACDCLPLIGKSLLYCSDQATRPSFIRQSIQSSNQSLQHSLTGQTHYNFLSGVS